ncbi:MAG: hypothetical protein H7301_02115 [Cryobacterium sp.]|nr:hypothetical protein [Oligoflexia bacterium]
MFKRNLIQKRPTKNLPMKVPFGLFLLLSMVSMVAPSPRAQATELQESPSYYDSFLFSAHGDCREMDKLWFYQTYSWETALLGVDDRGRPISAELSLQLFRDGSYFAHYAELVLTDIRSTTRSYDTLSYKTLIGKWSVNQSEITLAGIGTGLPDRVFLPDGSLKNSIRFRFTEVIHDDRILQTTMNLARVGTSEGPRGISLQKYCAKPPRLGLR